MYHHPDLPTTSRTPRTGCEATATYFRFLLWPHLTPPTNFCKSSGKAVAITDKLQILNDLTRESCFFFTLQSWWGGHPCTGARLQASVLPPPTSWSSESFSFSRQRAKTPSFSREDTPTSYSTHNMQVIFIAISVTT